MAHAGLAWSIGLGAVLNAGLLLRGLIRRGVYQPDGAWPLFLVRLAVGVVVLAAVLALFKHGWPYERVQAAGWHWRVLWLSAAVGSGAVAYFAALALAGFRVRDFIHRVAPSPSASNE
jgi:putative peptidoglycan lipid II flippase